jgi:hypothetical protein
MDVTQVQVAAPGSLHTAHDRGHQPLAGRQQGEDHALEQGGAAATVDLMADRDQMAEHERRQQETAVPRGVDDPGHARSVETGFRPLYAARRAMTRSNGVVASQG